MSSDQCTCEKPIPVERAERKGTSQTFCARCDKPIALTLQRT